MPLFFNAKTYTCEYMDFEVNEDEQVVVTLFSNAAPEQMTIEEATSIVNDPQFFELLCLAYERAALGTPLRCAFDRMQQNGGTAILRFEQTDTEVAA